MTTNLLLIDDSIASVDIFVNGLNSNTKHVLYNVADTFETLNEKIQLLNETTFDYVGFVFDDSGPYKMFVSYNTFMSFDQTVMTTNNTTSFIKNLVQAYSVKTLDFLACNLLSYTEWKNYFSFLIAENQGLAVRASEDETGNLAVGGDWILETTNEESEDLDASMHAIRLSTEIKSSLRSSSVGLEATANKI